MKKFYKSTAIILILTFALQIFSPNVYFVYAQNKKQDNTKTEQKEEETKKDKVKSESEKTKNLKGKIKSIISEEKIGVALEDNQQVKIGDELYITKNGQKVAKIKVVDTGDGWVTAKVIEKEENQSIEVGDEITDKIAEEIQQTEQSETKKEEVAENKSPEEKQEDKEQVNKQNEEKKENEETTAKTEESKDNKEEPKQVEANENADINEKSTPVDIVAKEEKEEVKSDENNKDTQTEKEDIDEKKNNETKSTKKIDVKDYNELQDKNKESTENKTQKKEEVKKEVKTEENKKQEEEKIKDENQQTKNETKKDTPAPSQKKVINIETPEGKNIVKVNGQQITTTAPTVFIANKPLVRLNLKMFTLLGCKYKDFFIDKILYVQLNSPSPKNEIVLKVYQGKIQVKYNGQFINISPAPYLKNGQIMIPLTEFYNLLGYDVAGYTTDVASTKKLTNIKDNKNLTTTKKNGLDKSNLYAKTTTAKGTKQNTATAKTQVTKNISKTQPTKQNTTTKKNQVAKISKGETTTKEQTAKGTTTDNSTVTQDFSLDKTKNKKTETKPITTAKNINGKIIQFIGPLKIKVILTDKEGIKVSDILNIFSNNKKIGEVKVLQCKDNWFIGWITKRDELKLAGMGDIISDKTSLAIEKKEEVTKTTEEQQKEEETKKKQIEETTKGQEAVVIKGVTKKTKEETIKTKKTTKTKKVSKEKKKQEKEKLTLAVVNIENKSGIKDKKISDNALDSLVYYFVKNGKYELVEREKINQVLGELFVEQGLKEVNLMDEATVQKIGKLSGADIVVIGNVSSIAFAGKPRQSFAEINVRLIDVETGKIILVLKSRGTSGKVSVDDKTLITKAIDNSAQILVAKLPAKITKIMSGGSIVINLGKSDGVKEGDILPVFRGEEELGNIKINIVHSETCEGTFTPMGENIKIQINDMVFNPKILDAQLPKAKKGMSKFLIYGGLGLVVVIVAFSGKKGSTDNGGCEKTGTCPPPDEGPNITFPGIPTAKFQFK